jgi:hypothetical protein
MRKCIVATFMLLCLTADGSHHVNADEVTKWNETATLVGTVTNPIQQSRIFAVTHAAIHDALNAINRRYHPYAFDIQVAPEASPEAAVAAAAHSVLVNQLPSKATDVNAAYNASLALIPDSPAKSAGIAVGEAAAAVILTLRSADGAAEAQFAYTPGTNPGDYQFTPPNDNPPFVLLPGWGEVTPFVLEDSSQFRPGPPYALTSKKYAADFNEVKSLGAKLGSARTAEQTEIALFWRESSPVGWNRIARIVSAQQGLTLEENARLFALLNLALADGYIGSYETKYYYQFWRPITAIRLADTDDNPDTNPDPAWEPVFPTPTLPDHDSAHSVEGGAAAEVLKRFFGSNEISFSTTSTTSNPPNTVVRTFGSFSHAAEENGLSRIYIGFHFRKAVTDGIKHGRKIGAWAFNHFLRPAH